MTTARPRHNRPNSAVYLGTDPIHLGSTPPGIPDLPEPPSPVSSSSGLPSPPATNSTGSGSTGDPASIAFRGTSRSAASMLNAVNVKAFHAAFTHDPADEDDDYDDHDHGDENDEDDTARINRRHSLKSAQTNENTLAIQRAMSLKERTRMTIDKLSSYSRNSPSPASNHRFSDSASSHSRQFSDQHHSGSETEREQVDSSLRPSTPRLTRTRLISAPASPGQALLAVKSNQSTASDSPSKSRKRVSMATSDFAELTSNRRIRSPDTYETPPTSRRLPDIAQAALAAVASSRGRTSPSNSNIKKRQPLPKEFFDAPATSSASGSGSTASVSRRGSLSNSSRILDEDDDYVNRRLSTEPTTPHHTISRPSSTTKHLQLSPRQQRNLNNTLTHSSLDHSLTDPRPSKGQSQTLRRHQVGARWVSEDMSSVASSRRAGDEDPDYEDLPNPRGRKQSLRTGGSADSALTVGGRRSLVGEGLKAAGLRNGGTIGRRSDVFDENTPLRDKVARDRERAQRIERIERSMSRAESRSRSRTGWDDERDDDDDDDEQYALDQRANTRTRTNGDVRTRAGTVVGPRASTSMAILDREREGIGGEPEPRTAPPQLRTYKSSYDLPLSQDAVSRRDPDRREAELEREREERPHSSLSRQGTVSSPFGSRRFVSNSNSGEASRLNVPDRSDHNRLLHDSLRMFETHVARVPSTSSATASDLLRNAQGIAGAAEKLNFMTRVAMSKALEAQINAEVDGNTGYTSVADVWRTVGAEYRDQMRVSDDLVRSVTDFLLGVGRAVKDMTGGDHHGRSVSLDELGIRPGRNSLSPENGSTGGGSAGSGRRSAESRRSWGDDVQRLSTGPKRSESALSGRPGSVLNVREPYETPPVSRTRQQPNGSTPAATGSSSSTSTSRRVLMTPREMRGQESIDDRRTGAMGTFDSQETIQASAYDPSPTPASRTQTNRNQDRTGANLDRARTLPPLSIPKPLAQLPSESRRQTQTPASTSVRRRPAMSGSNTVRGPFQSFTTPNMPTTALTPHTVENLDRQEFPLLRHDSGSGSGKSMGTTPRTSVTFSRSSTVSALTGLQQQQQLAEQQRQRTRTQSNSSVNEPDPDEEPPTGRITRTVSGSETERETRRSTIGRQSDRPRMSLDGSGTLTGNVHPADRSAATSILLSSTSKPRERRKTVVDVWPRGGS